MSPGERYCDGILVARVRRPRPSAGLTPRSEGAGLAADEPSTCAGLKRLSCSNDALRRDR